MSGDSELVDLKRKISWGYTAGVILGFFIFLAGAVVFGATDNPIVLWQGVLAAFLFVGIGAAISAYRALDYIGALLRRWLPEIAENTGQASPEIHQEEVW